MRTLDFRLSRLWTRNPNYKHGRYCQERWKLETAVRGAMRELPGLYAVAAGLGRWRHGKIQSLMDTIPTVHPDAWSHDLGAAGLYVPPRAFAQARSFLGLVAALRRLVTITRAKITAWAAFRAANDLGGDHGEPIERPRDRRRGQISAVGAQISRLREWTARQGLDWTPARTP